MATERSEPQRPEARLWLAEFNEGLSRWLASERRDDEAFDGMVRALRSLLERDPDSGTMVAELAVTLLHQHSQVLTPGRVTELAGVGLVAERVPATGSPRLRAWLEIARGHAELDLGRSLEARRAAALALSALDADASGALAADAPGALASLLRARAMALRASALDAMFEVGGALDAYRAADQLARPLVEKEQLSKLLAEALVLLYGGAEQIPREAVGAELQLFWRELSRLRIAVAAGAARTCALAAPEALDAEVEAAASTFAQHGLDDTSPLALAPIARHAGPGARELLRSAVLTAAEQTGLERGEFAAIFEAMASCAAGNASDARDHRREAERELLGVNDVVVAAAAAGSLFAGAVLHDDDVAETRDQFLDLLDVLDEVHDPRLDDARLRAAFDEPIALALLALAPAAAGPPGPDRVRLARIVDFELGLHTPLDRWLPPAGVGEEATDVLDAAGMLAADRLSRLERALRDWPGAAALVVRSAGPHELAICASADGVFVSELGEAHRDAAAEIVAALDSEVEAIELTGVAGPDDALLAVGRRAHDTLPEPVRVLIEASHTLLVCPDRRTGGDAVPYELFHDGTEWLGIAKVVARLPSLRALVRTVEGSSRRDRHERGLALAVPDVPDMPLLEHAATEVADARARLEAAGWDVPVVEEERVDVRYIVDRLPWIRHLHVAAHGEAEGVSEALLLPDGQRLEAADLQARFLPRMPSAYINACSLGATRWIGGGRSQGIAYAFFEAGSPAVIANLLPIDDRLASELSTAFYGQIGATVGDGLRAARAEARTKGSPVFWGSTVLMGDPRTGLAASEAALPLVDRLLDALMLGTQGEDPDELRQDAALALASDPDVRLQAATLLLQGVAALTANVDATSRPTLAAACRVAAELDYLRGAALLAALLTTTYGGDDDRAERLRVLEGALELLEPLEHDEGPWKPLLEQALAQWMLVRQGERATGFEVHGTASDAEQDELLGIARALRDVQLAIDARRVREGRATAPPEGERTEREILAGAVAASRTLQLEDMPEVAAFGSQVAEKLIGIGAVDAAAQPHAATAITGLLHWLWGSQNVVALDPQMAEGQAGTLGELVAAIRDHWPPAPSDWLDLVGHLPATIQSALDGLEDLPYDDDLYPAIDAAMGRIEAAVSEALGRVGEAHLDRAPDAMAFALGVLIERNTYSYLDGSVPEDIGERLKRVHTTVAGDAEAAFMPWLSAGFQTVREARLDELERWRLEPN